MQMTHKTAQTLWMQTRHLPLIAILRGLAPTNAAAVGLALMESGFRILEVPLNRPGALQCIEILSRELPDEALVGGGTMLTLDDVQAVHDAGGRLSVSPNCDTRVIARAVDLGMLSVPGVATPTEAFTALQAGAHALKIFPAEMIGQRGLKALKSVLPTHIELWPVGGISPESLKPWIAAGATGFGIGGQLFTPDTCAADVLTRGKMFIQAWHNASGLAM
jgi:2-dehydro-3-deoxyphosphogalactonate aldolase